ncbi:Nuclear pore complex protein like [Quillaja saponaria]|uniref:Nuclear pore complex protein like n=1 Tax=Quillaja saponaria TaxID=32244 RepID=A0AAD7L754_QUISA|nr:Nuclear pore complex protein like [Quillaja saponaria]
MKGRKRFALSHSNIDTNDSAIQNKRIMEGSPFDVLRAEPSQRPSMATAATPPLNMQRAESSRQHVRALNTQFASWVQTQLKDHPDELWDDGVKDYLAHASNIMEKFSDVVNWIRENALKGEMPVAASHTAENKMLPEVKNNGHKLFPETTGFFNPVSATPYFATPVSTTPKFATSWSSGMFSNSQTPVLFESKSSGPSNHGAADDVDGDNELEQPSSPSVKKSEEKGIVVVHEVKCKLYVKSSDPADKDAWKDKGMGQLFIKCKDGVSKGTKESKPTIVVRNEVGKLLLNALLYPGIKTNSQKNSLVAIFHTSGDSDGNGEDKDGIVARTFLIRMKTEEDRNKLTTAIQEYAPTFSE